MVAPIVQKINAKQKLTLLDEGVFVVCYSGVVASRLLIFFCLFVLLYFTYINLLFSAHTHTRSLYQQVPGSIHVISSRFFVLRQEEIEIE